MQSAIRRPIILKTMNEQTNPHAQALPFAGRVSAALAEAERLCEDKGLRLTPLRRRVLELVWSSRRPIGAYAILERMDKGAAAPPTVYRSLDFLIEHGLVHRIDSLKAFVGCPKPENCHAAYFLICENCGAVAEVDNADLAEALAETAGKAGFKVKREIVEIWGMGPCCRTADKISRTETAGESG